MLAISSFWVLVFKMAYLRNYATACLKNTMPVRLIHLWLIIKICVILSTRFQVTIFLMWSQFFLRPSVYTTKTDWWITTCVDMDIVHLWYTANIEPQL